jgi:hypothetical protein
MGWLDNLWRRRGGRATESAEDRARIRKQEEARRAEKEEADLLEERAHQHRDEEIFREPRKPPGTG